MTARRSTKAPVRRVRERAAYRVGPTGPIIVDASIAFLWFANEPDRWGAAHLLETDVALLAPELMAVEVTNAWWKKLRRREMELPDVEQAVTHLLALGITWTTGTTLLRPAARLAVEIEHPVYDCLYLVLAQAREGSLATADDRLRRAAVRLRIPIWSGR